MKSFNTAAVCIPSKHYMVDISGRIREIKKLVDAGKYFTINRARQYGKTTTLNALEQYLSNDYYVISIDFQKSMSNLSFESETKFAAAFARILLRYAKKHKLTDAWQDALQQMQSDIQSGFGLVELFENISDICSFADKPIVLMIDEVDQASNNQVFLGFLAQLRGAYISRESDGTPAFQSVILAGVHDIRNLQLKIRPDSEHRHNSPWNIAARFDVDMSFSPDDIAGMLTEYEADHHTGMDIKAISQQIYDYTSGYPVLVSMICKINDEDALDHAWTAEGIAEAAKRITNESAPLFESLINKIEENADLREMLYAVLFKGEEYTFNIDNPAMSLAQMYGFITNHNSKVQIANRIFETRLYNYFLSVEKTSSPLAQDGSIHKSEFIENGTLNMERILERFVTVYTDIYGSKPEAFLEEAGRQLFLLFLRPIINGTANYYIEARTRNQRRTDLIIDYLGEQFIIEMKIWHGAEYNARGEKQLSEYLDYYHINKGYMLSFNFNRSKEVGVHTIQIGDKTIVEAVV